ncbi:MAG: TauD/TfdA family dioxygenase [Zoogloea sp.]|nr:TauD/TfdA family dioxygenase [Zoogloea sp.]
MTDVSQLFRALAAAPTWTATQPQALADVTISPTGGALGAVVTGLDASRPLSGELVLALKRALQDHLILIFKGQQLEDEAFLRFASYFGGIFRPPAEVPVLASQATTDLPPDVVPVSNAVGQGDYTGHGELTAHVDHQWTPQHSSGSLLYAI